MFQFRVREKGSKELISLLHNTEPNIKEEMMKIPGPKALDKEILLRMKRFHGPVEKGYAFLQSFKKMNGSFAEKRKMQIFIVYWKERFIVVSGDIIYFLEGIRDRVCSDFVYIYIVYNSNFKDSKSIL